MKSVFKHSVLPHARLASFEAKLDAYVRGVTARREKQNCYDAPESSVLVHGDASYQRSIMKPLVRFKGVRHVILIGIGGSNLGTEAVYEALKTDKSPTLTVLDQIDGETLREAGKLVRGMKRIDDVVLVVVSKSGATTETIVNAVKVVEIFEKRFGEKAYSRAIFIGDKDTEFMSAGRRKGVLTIPMPKAIGGRYSVFTAVGMVPLSLLGIDVMALRRGAGEALSGTCVREAKTAAATLAVHALAGTHTVNFFTFGRRLETLGFWYRQLLAESIGKAMTTKGATFSHQLLPVVSTAVDLHSMSQLFFSGYDGLYTHLVYSADPSPLALMRRHWLFAHLPFLGGKSVTETSGAIVRGVVKAYDEKRLPYRKTELSELSAHEVGRFMNSLMLEVMCLAHLLSVDAFNQPEVELYKKHTRALLTR